MAAQEDRSPGRAARSAESSDAIQSSKTRRSAVSPQSVHINADMVELLAERGVYVDPSSAFDWVQRFTPLYKDAARPHRHRVGTRWAVDETYVKVAGVWRYAYRAIDEHGQVIDVYLSATRRPRLSSNGRSRGPT